MQLQSPLKACFPSSAARRRPRGPSILTSFVLSLEAPNATSITLESVLSVIRRGALQAPVQACWETFGTRRSSDTSKDAIFTDSDFSQNLIAGAPVHHISENIKNTMVFHPPGLQMQFYHMPRGSVPTPPTLQAGPLKSSKTSGKLRFRNIVAYVWLGLAHLGPSWGHVGLVLAPTWPSWPNLGALLGHLELSWSPSWLILGAAGCPEIWKTVWKTMFGDITPKIDKADA